MSGTTEHIDIKYRRTLEEETIGLERRRARDPSCTIADLQGILDALYVMEGNNWDGRGEMEQASLAATIAAYERFIGEWKKECGR